MKRQKLSRSSSKRQFKRSSGTHKLNSVNPRIFRGGIRL